MKQTKVTVFGDSIAKGLAIKDGKAFFIETKVEPNTPTQDQINFIKQMKVKNCLVY